MHLQPTTEKIRAQKGVRQASMKWKTDEAEIGRMQAHQRLLWIELENLAQARGNIQLCGKRRRDSGRPKREIDRHTPPNMGTRSTFNYPHHGGLGRRPDVVHLPRLPLVQHVVERLCDILCPVPRKKSGKAKGAASSASSVKHGEWGEGKSSGESSGPLTSTKRYDLLCRPFP